MWLAIIIGSILLILEIINVISILKNKKSKIFKTSFKVTIFLIIYTFIISIAVLIEKNSPAPISKAIRI